jgi:hypothetical protein
VTIVLSVVLRFTGADYLFGIFKLFMIFVDFKHSIMISSLFYGCKLIRQKKGSVRPDLNSGVWNVSNLVHTTRSGITFISYAHNQKVGKPNN